MAKKKHAMPPQRDWKDEVVEFAHDVIGFVSLVGFVVALPLIMVAFRGH